MWLERLNHHAYSGEQTAFLDNGKLFEYSCARHLWHTFNFETDFVRVTDP